MPATSLCGEAISDAKFWFEEAWESLPDAGVEVRRVRGLKLGEVKDGDGKTALAVRRKTKATK